MHDDSRTATFSSSSAYRLMTKNKAGTGFGAPALKYIKQTRQEIKLGRSIKNEFEAKQTSWGTFLEKRVFRKLLDSSYQDVTNDGRLFHPKIKHYSGIPDFLKDLDTVCDCKCPFNPEKFCDKMEALEDYGTFKEQFPEDFWQLISNTVLLRANGIYIKYMEAINYVPYLSELPDIRIDADGRKSMRWLDYHTDSMLPWLPDGGHYKNINIHRFTPMERDIEEWTDVITLSVDTLTGYQRQQIIGKRSDLPVSKKVFIDPGPKRISSIEHALNIKETQWNDPDWQENSDND